MNEITVENISINNIYTINNQQQQSNAFELDEQGGIARPEMVINNYFL